MISLRLIHLCSLWVVIVLAGAAHADRVSPSDVVEVEKIHREVRCAALASKLLDQTAVGRHLDVATEVVSDLQTRLRGCPEQAIGLVKNTWFVASPIYGQGAGFCIGKLFQAESSAGLIEVRPKTYVEYTDWLEERQASAQKAYSNLGCVESGDDR